MQGEPAADLTPPERRVALLVVPGVGDKGPGDDLDTVTAGLLAGGRFADAERRDLVLARGAPDEPALRYHTAWTRLRPADGAAGTPTVDVYEMYWADLSRFPAGLLRFAYTLVALLLQLATIGLEALRPYRRRGQALAEPSQRVLSWLSWTLAVPVLVTTGAVVVLTGALYVALTQAARPALVVAATIAFGAGTLALGLWGGRRLRRGGWRGGLHQVVPLASAALVGYAACRITVQDEGVAVGLANTLLVVTAYPFRIAWLAAAALAVASAGMLVALALARGGRPRAERARAAYTGLLTVVVAPVGIALSAAVLLASFAAPARAIADGEGLTWGDAHAELLCLGDRTDWTPHRCAGPLREAAERPVCEAAGLVCRAGLEPACRIAELCGGSVADRPYTWTQNLFGQALAPLLVTLAVVLVLLALAVLALLPLALTLAVKGRLGRRAGSREEGEGLRLAQRWLGTAHGTVPVVAAILLASVGMGWVWMHDAELGSADLAGGLTSLGALLGALLLLVRVLGIDPRRPFGSGSGLLERVRTVLDLPYDIASYLRVGRPRDGVITPRERMLARYRALLTHVVGGGESGRPYDALVIAAHSQGSVLTAAILFGDDFRQPPPAPIPRVLRLPPRVSLLTFGSPLRQTYDARFPGQYAWLQHPLAHSARLAALRGEWVNVYRAGDYIGRELWSTADPSARDDPELLQYDANGPRARFREYCLGDGTHTGYWSDPRWLAPLRHLVLGGAAPPEPWPGPTTPAPPDPARPAAP